VRDAPLAWLFMARRRSQSSSDGTPLSNAPRSRCALSSSGARSTAGSDVHCQGGVALIVRRRRAFGLAGASIRLRSAAGMRRLSVSRRAGLPAVEVVVEAADFTAEPRIDAGAFWTA
jgi:hypothetical protein